MRVSAGVIINKALEYLGTTANNNNVIFNTDYYGGPVSGSDYPWCVVFVWDIFKMCGASDLFYGGKKTASCVTVMSYYQNIGRFSTGISTARPGDLVLYNWDGGEVDHIGILICVNKDGTITTVEGNTAFPNTGPQKNGLGVARKVRSMKSVVGFAHPDYTDTIVNISANNTAHIGPKVNINDPNIQNKYKSQDGKHIVDMDDIIMKPKPKYDNVQTLEGIQTNPKEMKTTNFKQDYIVIIRKKLYYAISALDEEKYLRVYQINNYTNIRTSHSIYGRPATCSISIKGGERVICAEQDETKDKGWENWQQILKGWVQDNSQGNFHKDWRVGKDSFATGGVTGIEFKNLLKAREAKYGWRFSEKCDWEPMDEIYVFSKCKNEKYREANGEYPFKPIFFGFIDSISKTYQAGATTGLMININASDQLKLLQLSRVVNNPSKMPGVVSGGGIDISYNFPQDSIGCFAINDDFLNSDDASNKIVYSTLQNVFAGIEPYKFINRLCLDAGIPEKYLTKRIEKITRIPFNFQKTTNTVGDILNAEVKIRLDVCAKAAEILMTEFFADEEGNIVFKVPNYTLGINRLKDNNMGFEYDQKKIDLTAAQYVDKEGNVIDPSKTKATTTKQTSNLNPTTTVKSTSTTIEYKVTNGDTLYSIAKKFLGDGLKWKKIYEDNYKIIGKNANMIKPGQVLKIYKTSNNPQQNKTIQKQQAADNKKDLQDQLKNKEIKLVDGKTLSSQSDKNIPEISNKDIISFTLTDQDKEIYNMYEIQLDTAVVEFASLPQAVRRVVPDFNSIVRFGLRPHPAVINSPLLSSRQEAEYFGALMIQSSMANRYSGTVNMIEDSSIRIGDPIRLNMYDEHPFKDGYHAALAANAVFYVVGIERNIDIKNVSYMTLQLKAGRVVGQESIFDIFMPLYKYYWDDIPLVNVDAQMENISTEAFKMYTTKAGDTLSKIIVNVLGVNADDGAKFNDVLTRIVKLNLGRYGSATAQPDPYATLQSGDKYKLPKYVI